MSIIRVGEFQFKKFIDKEKIAELILKMAKEVDAFYSEKDELEFIVILDGSYHFASDFTRVFPRDAKVYFIKAKSYVGLKSSGDVKIQGLEEIEIKGKHLLILEDIVETGNTLFSIIEAINIKAPASLRLASLFVKPSEMKKSIHIDFYGLQIGSEFIVGYGLDYNGYGRTFPDVYVKI